MGSEATLDDDCSGEGAAKSLGRGVGHVAADVVSLAELQCQLLVAELRELKAKYIWAVIAWVAAAGFALAAIPASLIAVGFLLRDKYELSAAGAMACAVFAALVVAALLASCGWLAVRSHPGLSRSKEELKQNVQALKSILKGSAPQ